METVEEKVAKYGKSLIINFHILVKMTGIYDSTNEAITIMANKLLANIDPFMDETGEFTVKIIEGSFYIEGIRIKAGVSDIESFISLADDLKKRSIGLLDFRKPVSTDDLINLSYAIKMGNEPSDVQSSLESKLVKGITVGGPVSLLKEEGVDLKDSRAMAKRAYVKAVAAMKEVDNSIKTGVRLKLKRIKRALQLMVDNILMDESYLLRLTMFRNYKNYYYYHPANVAILSSVLGKRIGLSKVHLRALAIAAFFHDIGKVGIPLSILNKNTNFTQKEQELVKRHPADGVKILLKSFGLHEISILSMLVSFEHHMKRNLSGYPATSGKRKPNLFSRIVSITDDFDSLVSGKVYGREKLSTDQALKLMLGGSGTIYDPVILKAFAGMFL